MRVVIINIIYSVVLVIWIAFGAFFGAGGYALIDLEIQKLEAEKNPADSVMRSVGKVTFKNKKLAQIYIQERSLKKMFLLKDIPELILFLVTASCFGLLGGCVNLIKQMAFEDKKLIELKIVSIPILGLFCGLLILGISYLVPTLLVSGEIIVRPVSLIFLSLFAGLFSKKFHEWIHSKFSDFFK